MSKVSPSVMAPPGSLARLAADEEEARRQRELGFYGLLTSVAEPFTILPGPAGTLAEGAVNVGREGWGTGLLRTVASAMLPRVLGKAPTVMSISTRAGNAGKNVTDDMLADAAHALFRKKIAKDYNPIYQFSQKHPDLHISHAGKIEYELDPANIRWTGQGVEAINDLIQKRDPTRFFRAPAKQYVDAPELYDIAPAMKDAPLQLGYGRGGLFRPYWREKDVPALEVRASTPAGPKGFRGVLGHEQQHFLDQEMSLKSGQPAGFVGSDANIRQKMADVPQWAALSDDEKVYFSRLIYSMSHPEVRGRTAQARTLLSAGERQAVPPFFESVYDAYTPYGTGRRMTPEEVLILSKNLPSMSPSEKLALLETVMRLRPATTANMSEQGVNISPELELLKKLFGAKPASDTP